MVILVSKVTKKFFHLTLTDKHILIIVLAHTTLFLEPVPNHYSRHERSSQGPSEEKNRRTRSPHFKNDDNMNDFDDVFG